MSRDIHSAPLQSLPPVGLVTPKPEYRQTELHSHQLLQSAEAARALEIVLVWVRQKLPGSLPDAQYGTLIVLRFVPSTTQDARRNDTMLHCPAWASTASESRPRPVTIGSVRSIFSGRIV